MIDAINQAIAALHPNLAGVDVVQLTSVLVLSWLGGRVITHESHSCPLCDQEQENHHHG